MVVRRLLVLLAAGATLAIWIPGPWPERSYEGGIFLLACREALTKPRFRWLASGWMLPAAWGFVQLALDASEYRQATLDAALRVAAFGATVLVSSAVFGDFAARDRLLLGLAWFGCLLGVASVTAYYASPGKILWLFPSPYPDVWGPFLSRNNFAQFLELAFPIALWMACSRPSGQQRSTYACLSAVILACGLASASRAGAILLLAETVFVFLAVRPKPPRRLVMGFALGATAFAALAGGETLLGRFHDADPFRDRREIFASSFAMIAARPWTGYGLGTFATVYPEFARYDPGARVEHAHNDWLEWAAEGGWPYAALWALLALAVSRPAIASIWGIGVLAVFLHALVDYPFARIGVAGWLFILIGALENTGTKTAP